MNVNQIIQCITLFHEQLIYLTKLFFKIKQRENENLNLILFLILFNQVSQNYIFKKLIQQTKSFQQKMQFKQKLVNDRRQNEYKVYSSFTNKNGQSKNSINQRLQQEYQINKENQSNNPVRFRNFESAKTQLYGKQRYSNHKNEYGFMHSNNPTNNKPHEWIQRNRGASNRILIQENEYSEHPSMQQALEYEQEHSNTNSIHHTFGSNSNSKIVYNKFAGGNIYQGEQMSQHDANTVYIDKAFLTKSIEAEDLKRSNSQTHVEGISNSIFADRIRNGEAFNAIQTQTNKKNKLSQRSHVRHQSVNIDEENGRPLTFGIVQNCSMVKSQKWQPSKQEEDSQETNYYQNRRHEGNNLNQVISKEYIQQKNRREQMLDEILMKQSAEKANNSQRGTILRTQPNIQLTKSQQYMPISNHSLLRSQQHQIMKSVQRPYLMQNMSQSLRYQRSSRAMLNSVNSISINPVFPCNNHPNKKAKYRLVDSDEEMMYCSKCAINLLQQGFKVQQLKKDLRIRVQHPMGNSLQYTAIDHYQTQQVNMNIRRLDKRVKQLEDFQNRINLAQGKVNCMLQQIERKVDLTQIEQNTQALKRLFDNFSLNLQKIKEKQTGQMQKALNKQKYYINQSKNQLVTRLGSLQQIRSELNEYRCKFMNMDENEYHFLLDSFINKVQSYEQNPRKQNTAMKKQGMKRSQIKNATNEVQSGKAFDAQRQIQKIITQLFHRLIDKTGSQISFDKKEQQQSFDYYCQEAKQPFRSLFHDEEQENWDKVQSTRNQSKVFEKSRPTTLNQNVGSASDATDSPTFQKYGC